MPVLTKGIVLDCFYLLIFYFEKFSTDVCRLPCAVNVNLNLSIESTSRNECKRRFSFTCYNRISVTTNINNGGFTRRNSRWRRRKQRLVKQRSAMKIKGELWAILRLCWTALKTHRCKKMRIYNTALKLARFIHMM